MADAQVDKAPARQHVWRLLTATLLMFGFGFALVPLYDVICDITGLNGQDDALLTSASASTSVDLSRTVTIEFVTSVNAAGDWAFAPETQRISLHPGESHRVMFHAENPKAQAVVAQAVPSVSPWRAAKYLRKTECFCFSQQSFDASEAKEMPVIFTVDPELPDDVDTLTLSYTLFDVTEMAHADQSAPRIP